jgi:hypothetical protein
MSGQYLVRVRATNKRVACHVEVPTGPLVSDVSYMDTALNEEDGTTER